MRVWIILSIFLAVTGTIFLTGSVRQYLICIDKKEDNLDTSENKDRTKQSESPVKQIGLDTLSKYKKLLLKDLTAAGWTNEELIDLKRYLCDPRAVFLPREMEVNITHVETKQQYAHHLNAESLEMCRVFRIEKGELVRIGAQDRRVPLSIITAILKVESNFGTYPGKSSVFNIYWSMAISAHPEVISDFLSEKKLSGKVTGKKLARRSKWAKKELRDLLYIAQNDGVDPIKIMGSWAGAFGLCQFIPSSYRAYGQDGNSDGIVDLDNVADAASSIANYLVKNHWPRDGNRKKMKKVIMRYNHSEYYADCILELADLIEAQNTQNR